MLTGLLTSEKRSPYNPLFNPAILAQYGVMPTAIWDMSDISTLYTDTAGAVPATALGDAIGFIKDKSANGFNLVRSNTGNEMIFSELPDGRRGLQTNAITDSYHCDSTAPKLFMAAGVGAIVVTVQGVDPAGPDFRRMWAMSNTATTQHLHLGKDSSVTPDRFYINNIGSYAYPASPPTFGLNTPQMFSAVYGPGTGERFLRVNRVNWSLAFGGVAAFQAAWSFNRFVINRNESLGDSNIDQTILGAVVLPFSAGALQFLTDHLEPYLMDYYRIS